MKSKRLGNFGQAMDDMTEFYEERAAILEFCAGLPREKAEALAKAEMETWTRSKAKNADRNND